MHFTNQMELSTTQAFNSVKNLNNFQKSHTKQDLEYSKLSIMNLHRRITDFFIRYITSLPRKRCFAKSRDFLGNAKHFRLVRKCIYKLLLYGNHPNDSHIMKVIEILAFV